MEIKMEAIVVGERKPNKSLKGWVIEEQEMESFISEEALEYIELIFHQEAYDRAMELFDELQS